MIRKVRIENYKSVPDLALDLGRVTVLIGANGSGKSNILEAIALASAAAQNKLDNEFLTSRGIRVTATRFMSSAFDRTHKPIQISLRGDKDVAFACELSADEAASYPKLKQNLPKDNEVAFICETSTDETVPYRKLKQNLVLGVPEFFAFLFDKEKEFSPDSPKIILEILVTSFNFPFEIMERLLTEKPGIIKEVRFRRMIAGALHGYLIYAPENSTLRTFQAEGQILPLGIKGEGLFAHLNALSSETYRHRLLKIKESLTFIDWFENFEIPADLSPGERSIRIRDRFLPKEALFDQRSANEGFLFLLFYITLFTSPETPAFFSIDNIDTSLNPKLCIALLQQLVLLAKEHDKQVILTTHNPAVLDGLNLHDDEQRLLVVDRNKDGHTRVRRVDPPKPAAGQAPVSLSEAFVRGYIGGLPKNF